MRRHLAILFALGLGLAAVLGSAPPAGAQEQAHAHGQMAAPPARRARRRRA